MARSPGKRPPRKQGATGRPRAKAVPRSGQPRLAQERALLDVAHVLAGLDRPSAIIGGIAVIAWGFARFTADIDCAVAASSLESREILSHFERGGFESRAPDPVAFAEQNLGLEFDARRVAETLAAFDELLETDRLGDWQRLRRESP